MAIINRAQPKIDILGFIKTNLWNIILALYILFSLVYIARGFYYGTLATVYNNGQQQWYQQAVLQLADQLGKYGCNPLPINLGNDKTISIVNSSCVTGSTPTTTIPETK